MRKNILAKEGSFNRWNSSKLITLLIGILLFALIFSMQPISAQGSYVRAAPAYTYGYQTSGSFFGFQNYPQIDSSMCNNRQDFILQVDPLGCTPSIVRSDLLEQQNVAVFCPIVATQLNPLIDVSTINSMIITQQPGSSFSSNIAGVSYFPAQAALGHYNPSITSPYLGNIGYATIILRQQPNESAMPDFVQGNLTANINYNIQNAWGVGNAVYYLQQLSDADFNNNINAYSFWNGKGFVRLDSSDVNSATISVYSGVSGTASQSTAKQKIASFTLYQGKGDSKATSPKVYLPGFNFCMGGLNVKLQDLENPDTIAKIIVDSDVIQLKEGETFLNDKCKLNTVTKQGINQNVQISCSEDQQHSSFSLGINPKINLTISNPDLGTVTRTYSVGDKLFSYSSGSKNYNVYLGFIGNKGKTGSINDAYLWLMTIPSDVSTETSLSNDEIDSIANLDKHLVAPSVGQGFWGATLNIASDIIRGSSQIVKSVINGKDLIPVSYSGSGTSISGTNIQILGYAGAYDSDLSKLPGNAFTSYTNAMSDYQTIIQNYAGETSVSGTQQITYGQQALQKAIELANNFNQKRTALQLCQQYSQNYGSALQDICNDPVLLSSTSTSDQSVVINGQTHTISFEGITEPSFDQFGLQLLIGYPDGTPKSVSFQKDVTYYLNDTTGEYIQLNSLTPTSATFTTNLALAGTTFQKIKNFATGTGSHTLKVGTQDNFGSAYTFSIQKINISNIAKISIQPDINYAHSNASLNFKIGIEKRAIKLTPSQTKDMIQSLNKTINQLSSIQNSLNRVVTVGKTLCLFTEGTLLVKNFIANLGGQGVARQAVMRNPGGWDDKCAAMVQQGQYTSVENCLQAHAGEVDASVNAYDSGNSANNKKIQDLSQNLPTTTFQGEKVPQSDALSSAILAAGFTSTIQNQLNVAQLTTVKVAGQDIKVTDILPRINKNTSSVTQLEQLQLNSQLLSSGDSTVAAIARNQVQSILGEIWSNSNLDAQRTAAADQFKNIGITDWDVSVSGNQQISYYDGKITSQAIGQIPANSNVKGIIFDNKKYLVQLENVGSNNYRVVNVFDETGQPVTKDQVDQINKRFKFQAIDPTAYHNTYTNPQVQYYETGQYAGLPAIVPFDLTNGWYAAVKSNLPILGGLSSYDASGRASAFYVCNVGPNHKEENMGGDDNCGQFVPGTNQPPVFTGLNPTDAQSLMNKATNAIKDASSQHKSGVSYVTINGQKIPVGQPAANIPNIQCEDFMSPRDCNILFNVCDPVICPSSRCNLGGAYPVQDVIQSGVFGSIALCFPNYPQIKVPICLSGVNAGLQGYISVLKSYQQCLNTSLTKGQQVGICSEINSIYTCQFIWKQAIPIINYALPRIAGNVLGKNSGVGGGEYLGGTDALTNAQKSVDYFSQYYAANSYKAFQERSTQSVGDAVCKNFISLTTPNGGNLFDALVTPDSPAQYYGQFDEAPYTTATNPPTSQYNVFYHIYAGTDFPAYYQVYLKGSASSFYQDTAVSRVVATGFIPTGQFITNTSVFTAPSGYQQLCIVVNGQEQCGFQKVTTDFGINEITQQYLSSQATQNVTSEKACVSGTPSAYSFLNPNVQAGASNFANPAIYNQGIIRICSTLNPGQGTDSNIGTANTRWQKVGYCDTQNIGCWLDTQSVKNVIKDQNIANATLQTVSSQYIADLQAQNGLMNNQAFASYLLALDALNGSDMQIISSITQNISRVSLNSQKAALYLRRGNAFGHLASQEVMTTPPTPTNKNIVNPNGYQNGEICAYDFECQSNNCDPINAICTAAAAVTPTSYVGSTPAGFVSPVFEFHDGTVFTSNLYYKFYSNTWYWSPNRNNWYDSSNVNVQVSGILGLYTQNVSDKNKLFIPTLNSKTYLQGVILLMHRTILNNEGGTFAAASLTTDSVTFTPNRIFRVNGIGISSVAATEFQFVSSQNKWKWTPDADHWVFVPQTDVPGTSFSNYGIEISQKLKNLINKLNNEADLYVGAQEIFNLDAATPAGTASCPNCVDGTSLGLKFKNGANVNLNQVLAQKLINVKNDPTITSINWQITEAYPPTVTHSDSCHSQGTCVDLNIYQNVQDTIPVFVRGGTPTPDTVNEINTMITAFKNQGLNVIFETNSNTGDLNNLKSAGVQADSLQAANTNTAPSFHVELSS